MRIGRGGGIGIARRRLRSFDGTRITYYAAGPKDGSALVLCGGLGGGAGIWRALFERLAREFRVLTWDYRGLYRSEPAVEPAAYGMHHHVGDLLELLKNEEVESPVLVGWSMGVQVALELHRTHPDLPAGLVAIHGASGRPLESAFDSPLSARVSPYVLTLLRAVGPRFAWVGPFLTRRPSFVRGFVWSSQQLGMMAPEIDLPGFRDMAEEWTRLHLGVYADIFDALGQHDASDLLERVRTPSLVIAGAADRFIPLARSEQLAESLPDAELEVVPGATHFGLLEFPERIAGRVERFLGERLDLPRAARARAPRSAPRAPRLG
jgi:pimeloyl-ACP methyl ester carboxylesterase